ncbi:MAG: hypothetical protein WCK98_00800 [bacterium]
MNPSSLWKFFELVDEIHKYLGFINILGVFIILKNFTKNKVAYFVVTSVSTILALLIILNSNSVSLFTSESGLIILSLFLPLGLYLVLLKIPWLVKAVKFFEKFILFLAIFFFYTQAILGGCVIYSVQNILAKDYLRLESWKENGVFGSNIFPGSEGFLRVGYFILATAILLKIGKPRFVKKVLSKFKKGLIAWHQKSIK